MNIAILGRQPDIGLAELESVFGSDKITPISDAIAKVNSDFFDVQKLGGTPKAGKIILELPRSDWQKVSQKIIKHYYDKWSDSESKITLGLSAYEFKIDAREVQKTGIMLKQRLKKSGTSLRLVPNDDAALSSAVSHHNKLGLSPNKVELLIVKSKDNVIIAESIGSQNITAYARRDQARPMRDAFVGMLPPKLAQIMVNLAIGNDGGSVPTLLEHLQPEFDKAPGPLSDPARSRSNEVGARVTVLDPFCGTGVILQEAALMGFSVYGTDLSEKMIRYSRDNLNWLAESRKTSFEWFLHEGDAMNVKWHQPIDAVVSETYLGQPFSAPPSPAKLDEVVGNCNHILTEFLKNLAPQIQSGTPVCLAIPAWRDKNGRITHLPIVSKINDLGFTRCEFKNIANKDLVYFRENQVVARELLVLKRS